MFPTNSFWVGAAAGNPEIDYPPGANVRGLRAEHGSLDFAD